MTAKFFLSLCLIVCISVVFSARAEELQAADTASFAPVAVLKKAGFQFDPVIEGTVITHEFIIKNTGNAPLSIEKVKTGCGCTTADYTKQIPPGAKGKISIKGNTTGFAGRKFLKAIAVYTNDPKNRQLNLYFKGEVEAFALIEPKNIILKGNSGSIIQSQVTITPLKKYSFNIVSSYTDNLEKKITFTLEKKADKYLLTAKNQIEKAETYHGSIRLKTDNPVKSEIVIYVTGLISQ
ncbi:OS_HP2 family (seleno)protein [Desulfobacterium sp. N47]|uniref:OS_HP2 family (seleno)protein n=1 Tax=Desulfobacterium sp. N47 TaxID=3115210 RepID=UPI003CBE766E